MNQNIEWKGFINQQLLLRRSREREKGWLIFIVTSWVGREILTSSLDPPGRYPSYRRSWFCYPPSGLPWSEKNLQNTLSSDTYIQSVIFFKKMHFRPHFCLAHQESSIGVWTKSNKRHTYYGVFLVIVTSWPCTCAMPERRRQRPLGKRRLQLPQQFLSSFALELEAACYN